MLSDLQLAIATVLVSILALIQPWAIAAWKRYARKTEVDWFEHGQVELGFGAAGPMVAMIGTIRARHEDAFIEKITIDLRRARDGASHTFEWLVFRPTVAGAKDAVVQLAMPLLVSTSQPRLVHVLFADPRTQDEVNAVLKPIQRMWQENVNKMISDIHEVTAPQESGGESAPVNEPNRENLERVSFLQIARLRDCIEAVGKLERLCYWEAGEYSLDVGIHTARPDFEFHSQFKFVLSEEDSGKLETNAPEALREVCGQPALYNQVLCRLTRQR